MILHTIQKLNKSKTDDLKPHINEGWIDMVWLLVKLSVKQFNTKWLKKGSKASWLYIQTEVLNLFKCQRILLSYWKLVFYHWQKR